MFNDALVLGGICQRVSDAIRYLRTKVVLNPSGEDWLSLWATCYSSYSLLSANHSERITIFPLSSCRSLCYPSTYPFINSIDPPHHVCVWSCVSSELARCYLWPLWAALRFHETVGWTNDIHARKSIHSICCTVYSCGYSAGFNKR